MIKWFGSVPLTNRSGSRWKHTDEQNPQYWFELKKWKFSSKFDKMVDKKKTGWSTYRKSYFSLNSWGTLKGRRAGLTETTVHLVHSDRSPWHLYPWPLCNWKLIFWLCGLQLDPFYLFRQFFFFLHKVGRNRHPPSSKRKKIEAKTDTFKILGQKVSLYRICIHLTWLRIQAS